MHSRAKFRAENRTPGPERSVLARLGKNFGWLAASTGFSAVASLIYVGLTTRTLGPRDFGSFALVMTFGELVANLAQFQSWRAVIGFGAVHREAADVARLGRLFGYAVSLDWAGSLVGGLVLLAGVPLISSLLHWNHGEQQAAEWFGAALLFTSTTAPGGMLRLFDRFDLQVYSETAAQITRFLGCLLGWILAAGIDWFLCVWALGALVQLVWQWTCVLRLGLRPTLGFRSLRLAARENRHLCPFMVQTSLGSSLGWLWMQVGTIVVGARVGPVEAGGFRLAHRFSLALMKPVEIATKALLPEFSRFVARDDHFATRGLLVRVTLVSGAFATLMLLLAGFFGRELLQLVAGTRFAFAHQFLVLLCIAAAINVAGFALEPFHSASFQAGALLRAYVVATIVYGLILVNVLTPLGAKAAAVASIGSALAVTIQLGISASRILKEQRLSKDLETKVELT